MAIKKPTAAVSISNLKNVSFNETLDLLTHNLKKKNNLKSEVKTLSNKLRKICSDHLENNQKFAGMEYLQLGKYLRVLITKEPPKLDTVLKEIVNDTGYSLSQLDSEHLKYIKDTYSHEALAFVEAVRTAYKKAKEPLEEIDVEATERLKEEFKKLAERFLEAQGELEVVEEAIKDTEQYLHTFERIANIGALVNPKAKK